MHGDRTPRAPVGCPAILLAGLLCVAALSLAAGTSRADPAAGAPTEYEIKAAFLYRFLFFIKWPDDGDAGDDKAPVVIGILGRDPFGNAFAEIEGQPKGPGNRLVRIVRFGVYQPSLDLAGCDVLFISRSARGDIPTVLERLADSPVLVVADYPGFVDAGGMINLVLRDRLVRWEVNRMAMTRAGLRPQAQLLRNAVRILDAEEDGP